MPPSKVRHNLPAHPLAWDKAPGRLPLSGFEPTFRTMPWGLPQGIRGSNCYDYSLNDFRRQRAVKTTPGDKGLDQVTKLVLQSSAKFDRCSDVVPGILADNPGNIYREAAWNPCKPGFAKIQSFVGAPKGEYGDFHFYRQDKDVEYVAKDGDTAASVAKYLAVPVGQVMKAAGALSALEPLPKGKLILVRGANLWSHKAGWATGALLEDSCGKTVVDPRKACRDHAVNYNKYCGSFCVRVGSTSSR